MSRLSLRNAAEEEAGIDLTPMLDVVFIMLIFFIVTASFIKEAGIEINRPESSQSAQPSESKTILFSIAADNQIWLDGRRVDVQSVRAVVERLHAENPKATVMIQAHKDANNKTYSSVADQARQAGVYDVSLTVQP